MLNKHGEDDNPAKRLKISKYSWSDDDIKKDSIIFLYNKFREQLDEESNASADDDSYQMPMSPLDLIPNTQSKPEEREETKKEEEIKPLSQESQKEHKDSVKNRDIIEELDFIKTYIPDDPDEEETKRYRNFRQDSKGILTIEQLCEDDNKSTPTREMKNSKNERNADDHSNLTFNTVSINKSDNNAAVSF